LPIPGSTDSVPGAEKTEVKDAGIIATGAGIGAALGGLEHFHSSCNVCMECLNHA
jgi:hypothetical protein